MLVGKNNVKLVQYTVVGSTVPVSVSRSERYFVKATV